MSITFAIQPRGARSPISASGLWHGWSDYHAIMRPAVTPRDITATWLCNTPKSTATCAAWNFCLSSGEEGPNRTKESIAIALPRPRQIPASNTATPRRSRLKEHEVVIPIANLLQRRSCIDPVRSSQPRHVAKVCISLPRGRRVHIG